MADTHRPGTTERYLPPEERRSVLGPADPEALAWAAEELRERTMQFEPEEPLVPRPWLFWSVIGTVAAAAGTLLFFGRSLRDWISLL